uniref:Uroporphyrinogen decarboxylase n=1 Tax=Phaeomonas parva TaxID=124430 RepID=A0A7S1TXN2_9STRA
MKTAVLLSALMAPAAAFQAPRATRRSPMVMQATPAAEASAATAATGAEEPLLLRAAKGQVVERPPVWMMRQAGRHMKVYRDLVPKHPTFRERSENPELSYLISMQPYEAYKTDGVILFSDILTPLPGMNVPFDIKEREGPVMEPWLTMDKVNTMTLLDPVKSMPFVGETLRALRKEVGNDATVLGFVGCPYTLATYMVEGKSSKEYLEIKKMMHTEPELMHKMLQNLAENIGNYANYQIESGAQVIQIFDSWASHLSPFDYDIFAAPYQKMVVDAIKKENPDVPVIIYINKSGALLERMRDVGVDIVSLDWTVDMAEARARLGEDVGVQGNLDPGVLMGSKDTITERTLDILKKAGPKGHVMNLGHGIEAATPEENAKHFIDTVKAYRH